MWVVFRIPKMHFKQKEGAMKRATVVIGILMMLCFTGQTVSAQEAGMFGIGARLSYFTLDDDSAGNTNLDFDDSFGLGINGTYYFCPWFSVELSLDYLESDIDASGPAGSGNLGELEQMPLLLTGRFHWPMDQWLSPYLAIGIGYYFHDLSANGGFLAQQGISSIDADDSFGYHLGVGMEWFLNPMLSFNVDLKYIWNEVDFDSTDAVGTESFEVDMDGFVIGIGLKYFF